MPTLVPIDSAADPRLAPYLSMRDAELLQRTDPLSEQAHGGMFIAEGDLVLARLVDSPFAVHSALIAAPRLSSVHDAIDRLPPSVPVFVAPPALLNSIVGFNMHRGVLAVGLRPPAAPLDTLLARPGPLIVLEDVNNHDNLGSVFRNVAALGGPGAAVLLSPGCADPLYRKAIRVSMGNVLHVRFGRASIQEWNELQVRLAAAGFASLALTPDAGATDLRSVQPLRRIALFFGAEGPGLTPSAMSRADRSVRIPMWPGVDSLNVSVAVAVTLAHLCAPPLSQTSIT